MLAPEVVDYCLSVADFLESFVKIICLGQEC